MATPKKAMPKPKTGRASIYKGTDKTTNKRDRIRTTDNDVVYADGSTRKNVMTERGRREASAGVYGSKKGNVVTTRMQAIDPVTWGPYAGRGLFRRRSTETTIGAGGRRESVVKKGDMGNVISEKQLNRGSGTRKTGAKKKAY
jgi:hypothetical protein